MLLTAFIWSTKTTAQETEKCIPVSEWAEIVADLNAYLKTYRIMESQKEQIESLEKALVYANMKLENTKMQRDNTEALYEDCKESLESNNGFLPWLKNRARDIVIGGVGVVVGAVTVLILKK